MTGIFFRKKMYAMIGLLVLLCILSLGTAADSRIDLGSNDYISGRDISVRHITGIEVIDVNQKKIGMLKDFLFSKNNKVAYAVIAIGGVYGVETEKQVAVPFERQRIIKEPTDTEKVLALNVSLQVLQQEPEYKRNDADASRFHGAVGAGTIIGLKVFGKNDSLLGVIEDLIFNNSHDVRYAIIRTSGVSGISNKLVAAPYRELTVNKTEEEKITLNITDAALESAPGFQY